MTARWKFAAALFALTATAAQTQELPKGWGSSSSGVFIFRHKCESCHGEWGGRSVGASTGTCFVDPVRLFHYVKTQMPADAPGTLKDTEIYHAVAYVLAAKGIIPSGFVINAQNLPNVVIPTNGTISSACPKTAGGLGKYESMKDGAPKTMPALLPASAAIAAPQPPSAAAKPKRN